MPYDVRPGQPFTPTILFLDKDGAPVTGTTTGTKIMTVYGPGSATLVTNGGVSHKGGGRWGLFVSGSSLTTPGTYRFVLDQIIDPTGLYALVNATGEFTVGYDAPNAWTLRELYTSIRLALRDGWPGKATSNGTTSTLIDAALISGSGNNDWAGCELLLFVPGATTDTNPVRVTSSTASTGTLTWASGQPITATITGQDYILGNLGGRGWSHAAVMAAIAKAYRETAGMQPVENEVDLVFDTSTSQYTVPSTFRDVSDLWYQFSGANPGEWVRVAHRYWRYDRERQRIEFTRNTRGVYSQRLGQARWGYGFSIPNGAALRIAGTAIPNLPGLFGAAVDANGGLVRDRAIMELQLQSPATEHRQAALMRASLVGRRVGTPR